MAKERLDHSRDIQRTSIDVRGSATLAGAESTPVGRVELTAQNRRPARDDLPRRAQVRDSACDLEGSLLGNRRLQSQSMFGVSALTTIDINIGMSGPGGMFGDTPSVGAKDLIGAYS